MAKTSISKRSRNQMARFYRKALRDIVELISSSNVLESERPRLGFFVTEIDRILGTLDTQQQEWAREEIERLYGANFTFIDNQIRLAGIDPSLVEEQESYASIHNDAINQLVTNVNTGLGPRLTRVINEMKSNLRGYATQHRSLVTQLRDSNQVIAQGILTGASSATTRNTVLKQILNKRPKRWQELRRFATGSQGGAVRSLADAPWLVNAGGRRLHVFDHVQTLVNTKEAETRNTARNNRLLDRGIDVVRISPNPPLTPDACAFYAGRVFALTEEAAERTGYPLLNRLPNGGPPFHPNCTHSTMAWFGENEDETVQALAEEKGKTGMKVSTRGGVPDALLDISFGAAQRKVKEKGGFDFILKQNPQLAYQTISTLASKEVQQGIARAQRELRKSGDWKKFGGEDPPAQFGTDPGTAPTTTAVPEAQEAPPPPTVTAEKYTEDELKKLVANPVSEIDYSRVPFVRDHTFAQEVAFNEIAETGIFGRDRKTVNKFIQKLRNEGLNVTPASFVRGLLTTQGSIVQKAWKKEFGKVPRLQSKETLKLVRDSLKEANGGTSKVRRDIKLRIKNQFSKAKRAFFNSGFRKRISSKKYDRFTKEFEEWMDRISPKVLKSEMDNIRYQVQGKPGRAAASSRKNTIQLWFDDYEEKSPRVHIHEFGHHIEFRNRRMRARNIRFLDQRWKAAGKKIITTRNEPKIDDAFYDRAQYTGRLYAKGAMVPTSLTTKNIIWTEVTSMGLEALENPIRWAQMIERDPGHFFQVYATLRGY